jgi:hypothetical protein
MKTESHEEIIKEFKLVEMQGDDPLFVRVEITADDMRKPLKEWEYNLDQDIKPRWYDEKDVEKRARVALKEWFKEQVFLSGHHEFKNGEHVYLFGNASASLWGSSTVKAMWDSSTVKVMLGSSTVEVMRDSSTVKAMWDSSTVKAMWNSSTVEEMRNSSTVKAMWDSSTVKAMWGSSTVEAMRDSSTVKAMRGSSTVKEMWDSSTVKEMRDSSTWRKNGEIHVVKGKWKFIEEEENHEPNEFGRTI